MKARSFLLYVLSGALLAMSAIAQGAETPARRTASGTFEGPGRPVWVGEAFDLTLTWRLDWDAFRNLEGPLTWTADPLVAEPWRKPALSRLSSASGQSLAAVKFQTRALALRPGTVSLRPAQQIMVLQTGVVTSGDYERAVTESVPVQSEGATLEVRPLPAAPQGFSGAVGRFTISASAEPMRVAVGEAVTWTLTLAGVGNWPYLERLPTRQVSRDFEVVGKPRVSELPGATLFERSTRESVVLIPRRAGRYVLGPIEMIVFDPESGRYVRLDTPAITLDVQPGSADASAIPSLEPEETEIEPDAGQEPTEKEELPALLDGKGAAHPPMTRLSWRWALATPPVAVFAFWMLMALVRARQQDPERVARSAHARLRTTLRKLGRARNAPERRQLVRSWQRDTALRWKLGRAAPVPASFGEHDAWRQLWAEADVFLYGRSGALPQDWTERAHRLLIELGSPPWFEVKTMFTPANLRPPMLVIVLTLMYWGTPTPVAAQESTEASWREMVKRDPLDWKARYNLAITLATQERWDEAAGHAGVAWVQQPAAEMTRELWIRTAREAGYTVTGTSGIPLPVDWLGRAAGIASPATWQWIIAALGALTAAGAMLRLLIGYGRAKQRLRPIGSALMLGAGATGAVAWILLNVYGAVVERDAVLVWRETPLRSLPVDTPPESVPEVLMAGTSGRVDGSFLDWRRVILNDGRTGWLRQENVIWVWGHPPPQTPPALR